MASAIENLGFQAEADVAKAVTGFGQLEGSIRKLEQAIARFNRASKLQPIDNRQVSESIRTVERDILGLAAAARDLNRDMGGLWADVGLAGTRQADAVQEAFKDTFRTIREDLADTRRALEDLHNFQPPGHGAGGAGGGRGNNRPPVVVRGFGPGGSLPVSQHGTWTGGPGGHGPGHGGGGFGGGMFRGMQSAGGALAGLAGVIGLGGLVTYVMGAVKEQAEEYTREAQVGVTLRGRGSIDQFADTAYAAGDQYQFMREESMAAAQGLGKMAGSRGLAKGDLSATMGFARAFGMDAGAAGDMFGRAGQVGVAGQGQMGRLGLEIATAIASSNMQGRAVEAAEASLSVLEEMSDHVGNLGADDRFQVLALQAMMAARGSEMFRGAKGAQVMRGMSGAIRPGAGDEHHEGMINVAFARYGNFGGKAGSSMDPLELLMQREKGATLDNLRAIATFAQKDLGGNMNLMIPVLKDLLGFKSLTQTHQFIEDTGGLTSFDQFKFDPMTGKLLMDENLDQQGFGSSKGARDGKLRDVRGIAKQSEGMRRTVGEAALPLVKGVQEMMLSLGQVVAKDVTPALSGLGEVVKQLSGDLAKGDLAGALSRAVKSALSPGSVTEAAADAIYDHALDNAPVGVPRPQLPDFAEAALVRAEQARRASGAHHKGEARTPYNMASIDFNAGGFETGHLVTAGERPMWVDATAADDPQGLAGYGKNAVRLREGVWDEKEAKWKPGDTLHIMGHLEALAEGVKKGTMLQPLAAIGYAQARATDPEVHGKSGGPHLHTTTYQDDGKGGFVRYRPMAPRTLGLGRKKMLPDGRVVDIDGITPEERTGKPVPASPPPALPTAPKPAAPPPLPQPGQQSAAPGALVATITNTFYVQGGDKTDLEKKVAKGVSAGLAAARERTIATHT